MNKKLMGLFIIFFVAIFAVGCVSAANLENHNFNNYFSMKIPKDISFEKENDSSHENGFDMDYLTYASDELVIMYFNTPIYTENSSQAFYQMMFESIYPDLSECYESQEGNLTIIEPKNIDEMHIPIVGSSSGTEIVIIAGQDLKLIKQMGKSIDFN